jgi:hypothetical protein
MANFSNLTPEQIALLSGATPTVCSLWMPVQPPPSDFYTHQVYCTPQNAASTVNVANDVNAANAGNRASLANEHGYPEARLIGRHQDQDAGSANSLK